MVPAPCQIIFSWRLKRLLGCSSTLPVRIADLPFPVRADHLDHHDLHHLQISQLPRIQIGKYWVSGIHGVNEPLFHEAPIVPEYDGIYDEARIAVHEWLTQPSAYTTVKGLLWVIWFASQGINPIAVIMRHDRSLKIGECWQSS